jgi:hypothetical protein
MKSIGSVFGLSIAALFALSVTACGPDKGASGDDGEDAGTTGTTGDDESGTGSGSEDDGSFLDTGDSGSDDGSDPLPNGEMCDVDEDCVSMKCFNTAVGSVCSECKTGQECIDAGDGINCTFNGMFFECSDGAAGEMCDDAESCMDGLFCSQVVNTGGLIPDKFCSECDTSEHCTDPQVCNPEFVPDLMMPMGQNKCTDPGSVGLDLFCDHEGDGNVACESGICSVADIMGFVMLGVCGECFDSDDCGGGACTEAMLNPMDFSVMGSRCE